MTRSYKTANFDKPPLDLRPRPPSSKGWELYHALGHYPPIPDTDGFRRTNAYHETGHAVAAVHLDIPFARVWMEHPKTTKARVSGWYRHPVVSKAGLKPFCEANAIYSLAGPEAEFKYAPRAYVLIGAGYEGKIHGVEQLIPKSDLAFFWRYIRAGYPSDQHNAIACELFERTRLLVKQWWPEIQVVAEALFERGVLREVEVRELVNCPPRNKSRYR